MTAPVDRDQIARTIALLRTPGGVIELRIPRTPAYKTESGYFDDPGALITAAIKANGHAAGLYTTLNEVDPALLARAKNRLKLAKATTTDANIRRRRWILLDFDPTRPTDISSTDAEHDAALAVARTTRTWLVDDLGVPADAIALADSGNGAHLLIHIDLPNDDPAKELVERCLEATALYRGTQDILVDLKVGNAARISKLYGTLAAKGDETPDRPHRLARLLNVPATPVVAPIAVLEQWAATLPTPGPAEPERGRGRRGDFDVRAWLAAHGATITREKEWKGGTLLELAECPFNPDHERSARIIVEATGRLLFGCFHQSCAGKHWADVREQLVPGWRRERQGSRRPAADTHARPAAADDIIRLTDVGNARRLVAAHGEDLRYCAPWKKWLVWDGCRWARDERQVPRERAKAITSAMLHEASALPTGDLQKALAEHALRSQKVERLRGMIELAQSDPAVALVPADFDADPWLLTVNNGTLDLRTGQLREHRRDDLITKLAPVTYDPAATSDVWTRFLADAMQDNADLIAFLQRCVGYSLTGTTGEEVLFFLHGPEASGKSTFAEAIKATFGDYQRTTDFETFLQKKGDRGIPNDIAALAGARLVVSIEMANGKRLAEGLIKQLTGGDTVSARFLHAEFFDFIPQFKLWLAANDAPAVRHSDRAIWRRILRIPFEHSVPETARDPAVKATLKDPARGGPAILAWAVAGCLAWQRERLRVPDEVRTATASYRAEQDPLRDFLADCCVLEPDAWTPSKALYDAYRTWAESNGDGDSAMNSKTFGLQLAEHGCRQASRKQKGKLVRGWLGIRFQTDADAADPGDPGENDGDGIREDTRKSGVFSSYAREGKNPRNTRNLAYTAGGQRCPKCNEERWTQTLDPAWGHCVCCGPVRVVKEPPPDREREPGEDDGDDDGGRA
jgi:putative DNA primase/helicase